jgi:hypothetical protein
MQAVDIKYTREFLAGDTVGVSGSRRRRWRKRPRHGLQEAYSGSMGTHWTLSAAVVARLVHKYEITAGDNFTIFNQG